MNKYIPVLLLFSLSIASCNRKAQPYDFPKPVDTSSRQITPPERGAWPLGKGLSLSTDFASARLADVRVIAPGRIEGFVAAENDPINVSPWYAFSLVAPIDTSIAVTLRYPNAAFHRYWPKLSSDRVSWARIDGSLLEVAPDSKSATVRIALKANERQWLSAQEIHNSADVAEWARATADHPAVTVENIGRSAAGKPIARLTVRREGNRPRATIVILSRQHPPEVTGYLAMQSFLEGLLEDPRLNDLLKRYQILVYPILNPDGVDAGHWRHNNGGVDLNRDWAFYRQPETALVANDIVRMARKSRAPVVLGLDFHSTWKDVYYTHDESVRPPSVLGGFKDRWLAAIESGIGGDFRINEEAEPIGRPTSMSWFRTQFKAEGITYEIGDDTPRDFVALKGRVSARALIRELMRDLSP